MKLMLILLIGPPGCGKTTLSRNLENCSAQNSLFNFVKISYDDVLLRSKPWKEQRTQIYKDIERVIVGLKKGRTDCMPGYLNIPSDYINSLKPLVIVIDDNMYYRSMRYPYYRLARVHSVGFGQIYIECCLKDCLKYNAGRKNEVPERIVKQMYSRLEKPKITNYWEINSLVVDYKDNIDYSFFNNLEVFFCNNPPPYEEKTYVHQSIIHQVDIKVRKLINELVKSHKDDKKQFAEIQKERKLLYLDAIRNGEIKVDSNVRLEQFVNETFCTYF